MDNGFQEQWRIGLFFGGGVFFFFRDRLDSRGNQRETKEILGNNETI